MDFKGLGFNAATLSRYEQGSCSLARNQIYLGKCVCRHSWRSQCICSALFFFISVVHNHMLWCSASRITPAFPVDFVLHCSSTSLRSLISGIDIVMFSKFAGFQQP